MSQIDMHQILSKAWCDCTVKPMRSWYQELPVVIIQNTCMLHVTSWVVPVDSSLLFIHIRIGMRKPPYTPTNLAQITKGICLWYNIISIKMFWYCYTYLYLHPIPHKYNITNFLMFCFLFISGVSGIAKSSLQHYVIDSNEALEFKLGM